MPYSLYSHLQHLLPHPYSWQVRALASYFTRIIERLEENLHWISTTTSTHLPVSVLTRSTLLCGPTPSPSWSYQKPMPVLRCSYLDLTPSCPVREAYSSSSLLSPPFSALYCIIPTSIWICCYVLKNHIFPWPISCCLIFLFSFTAKLSKSCTFPTSTICLLPFSLNSFSSAKEYILCPDPTGDFLNLIFIFYWRVIDLQCCISFCCTEKWFSYTYTYIHSFSDSFLIRVITEYWVELPVLYSRNPWVFGVFFNIFIGV